MNLFVETKLMQGNSLMKKCLFAFIALSASPAIAHPGAHVHPHDGASWLAVVGALVVITAATGVAVAKARS